MNDSIQDTPPASTSATVAGAPVATAVLSKEPIKPGWQTTEFWLSGAATILPLIVASGLIPTSGDWPKMVALAISLLGAMGYTAHRNILKTAASVLMACLFLSLGSGCASSHGLSQAQIDDAAQKTEHALQVAGTVASVVAADATIVADIAPPGQVKTDAAAAAAGATLAQGLIGATETLVAATTNSVSTNVVPTTSTP